METLAEDLLEGSFVRALKPKLQPVQIAKALTKEMEANQMVAADALLVPNHFAVYLNPDDLARFAPFQAGLETELAAHLKGYAARRGFKLLSPPTVTLSPASSGGRAGRIRVEGTLVDAPAVPAGPTESAPAGPASHPDFGQTAAMPAAPAEATRSPRHPPAALLNSMGGRIELVGIVTTLGRAVDNDVVLEDAGVSRHHARIAWEPPQYVLHDLGSTNGSFASGQKVTHHPLSDGEQLSFGEACFTFSIISH